MALLWLILILAVIVWIVSFLFIYKPIYTGQLSQNLFDKEDILEHTDGISLKLPWYILQDPEIDMKSSIIITSGGILLMNWDKFISEQIYKKIEPRIYETQDSVLYGSWATAIRPAPGFLKNFILKTPQVAALMIMSEIDLKISDHLATKETEEVLRTKLAISEEIEDYFGGDDEITMVPIEESYGVIVSNPKLFDLNLGKRSQDAAEKLFEAKKFREAIDELKDSIADEKTRANAVFTATGMAQKKIIDIEGIEGATKNIADSLLSFFTKK